MTSRVSFEASLQLCRVSNQWLHMHGVSSIWGWHVSRSIRQEALLIQGALWSQFFGSEMLGCQLPHIRSFCIMATLNQLSEFWLVTGNWHRPCLPGAALLRSERPSRASRRSTAASLRGCRSAGRCLRIWSSQYYSAVPASTGLSKYAWSKGATPCLC